MAVIQAIFTLSQKFCEHILRAESLGALMVQVRQHLAETRDAFNRYTGEPLDSVAIPRRASLHDTWQLRAACCTAVIHGA